MATSTTTNTVGSIATLMSTGLNSLADGDLVLGSAYSSSGNYRHALLQLTVELVGAPAANSGVAVWLLLAIDGSTYEDGGTSVTPGRNPDVVFAQLRAVDSVQVLTMPIDLEPGTFKPLLKNDGTGQAFESSGATLKILPYTEQSA